jgi:hypothetical protein
MPPDEPGIIEDLCLAEREPDLPESGSSLSLFDSSAAFCDLLKDKDALNPLYVRTSR